jgi:uncharacterized protein YjbI with pentapeptide repeats
MNKTFQSLIQHFKGNFQITDQTFSDEIIFKQHMYSCNFIQLIFLNCSFNEVNFNGSSLVKCEFNGCTFNESRLQKIEVDSCRFQNCKFINSKLDKADFDTTIFNSCQFQKISLGGGYFLDCQINESNFEEITTDNFSAIIVDSQFSKSERSIKLKGDFNFNDLLKFFDS